MFGIHKLFLSDRLSRPQFRTHLGCEQLDERIVPSQTPMPAIKNVLQIGDRVWLDANHNDKQDDGETGVGGVTVELISSGAVVATTLTTGEGEYDFGDLEYFDDSVSGVVRRGQVYSVHFVKPAGYRTTDQKVPGVGDKLDSDPDPATGVAQNATAVQVDPDPTGGADLSMDCGLVAMQPTTTTQTVAVTWPAASRLPTGMTLTATVQGNAVAGPPTGSVRFLDGANVLGTAPLVAGPNNTSVATLATAAPAPAPNRHNLSAVYNGDANYTGSSDADEAIGIYEDTDGQPPLTAAQQGPQGGTLTWANFQGPVNQNLAAFTFIDHQYRAQMSFVTVSVLQDGVARAESRGSVTAAQYYAIFISGNSFVRPENTADNPTNNRLRDHEILHLTIAQWTAARAAANRPAMSAVALHSGTDLELESRIARRNAFAQLDSALTAYANTFLAVSRNVDDDYDTQTNHGAPVAPPATDWQLLWQANWEQHIRDRYLTPMGWNL